MEGDGGGGGRERGTRDEVMIWSGRERLNFMGQLWRRCRRREQSRAEQSRAEQSRAEQSRAEQSRAEQSRAEQSRAEQSRAEQTRRGVQGTGIGKMEKWQKAKGEECSDDVQRGQNRNYRGGLEYVDVKNGNTAVCWIF